MVYKQCFAENCKKFGTEMNIHFPGWDGLDKPAVWVFPKIMVSLDCGFAEFSIPEAELLRPAEDAA